MGGVKYTGAMKIYLAEHSLDRGGVGDTSRASDIFMKLHLAERDPQHHAWPKHGVDKNNLRLRVLLSYWYYKDTDLDALFEKYFTSPFPEVFADSGAYSAMTQGAPVNIDDYAAWIKRYKHLFSTYANLDVIKDAKATQRNQHYLEDKHALAPLPAFHVLEDFKYLEYYLDRYPYIALGVAGMQQRKDEVMRWLVKCFKMADNKSVYHGFALTSWQVMSSFPWYSVDSSSWGQGFRFGNVPVFDFNRGKFFKAGLGDNKSCSKLASLIGEYGFDWRDFADRSRNDRAKICAISALSYMMAEQWLRKRFGEIRIPGQSNAPAGLRAHLADANPNRYIDAKIGIKLHIVPGDGSGGPSQSGNSTTNTGLRDSAESVSGTGVRLHLADTSNGVNFGDADKGIKLHLADAQGGGGRDLEGLGKL